ncbi:hypothetical protein BDR04DRAFT_579867 [Suillus decipiens]|nr:hypothetical protein BDR04DRAFT_579867 [Suillus decipiens]
MLDETLLSRCAPSLCLGSGCGAVFFYHTISADIVLPAYLHSSIALLLPLPHKLLVCDRDTTVLFHSGLRYALVGCALTCSLPRFFRSFFLCRLFIGVSTLGADGYVLNLHLFPLKPFAAVHLTRATFGSALAVILLLHNLRLTYRLYLPIFPCQLPTSAIFSVFPLRLHLLPTLNFDVSALPTRHLDSNSVPRFSIS